MLRGFTTYEIQELINPTLKAQYSALDSATLLRRCGREIITRQKKGAQVALIYHLEDLSESTVSKLERSFQGGVSSGALSVDSRDKFQQFLSKAASVSKVRLNFDAIGGPGVAAVSGLVTANDDVSRVETVVSNYMSRITPNNAAGWQLFSASTLTALAGREDAQSDRQVRQVLVELYKADTSVQSKLTQVRRVLDPNGIYLSQLDQGTVERLSTAEGQLTAAARAIRTAADRCSRGEECAPINSDVTRIDVSFLPKAPNVRWRNSDRDELEITLTSADSVSEVYLRPSWVTGIPGVGDEPTFTRKIWSSEADSEAAILRAGRSESLPAGDPFDDVRDFLYLMDRDTSKVTASGSTILLMVKRSPIGALNYMYIRGQAPPVTHEAELIVRDRFGRAFTLKLRSQTGPQTCPELQQCGMDDLQ